MRRWQGVTVHVMRIERDTRRFRRRLPGHVPGQGRVHSQIELSVGARFLLIHLASAFTVALMRSPALQLLHSLADGSPHRIDAWDGWLNVEPYQKELPNILRDQGPPTELAIPKISVVFCGDELRRDLTAAYLQLVP